uniref:hypothetical chloroplast RF1 n=1 Tax=Epimedium franchetii TaxID=253603 RepID=UPI00211F29BA|nr:hypothetical chloroplast RF1 [Epimedium franchetii]YP_010450432.1 hypothetical chloroplast RF1 [Epimedium stellulatum x Epimedium franchetii]UTU99874.1 hypothetical chloroplast RF1 [Epimedium franchetii]UTU99957.1 hypothetical chloroplast RF1 [Epimedium stellulatum x Epimedium franchetii]UTV00041.1 hypothetical chloroplast RF1 [Epimedium stellulatum]
MIFHPFRIGNILSLCMKIINSVVVVGLYYGFLTIFSIGPSYLLLLQARVMEEGTQKEVAATTGFITGQLMILLSIYYAPLYLALARPHTVTVIVLPYFLFQFFWNNHKYFFDYTTNTKNSMRNLTIQFVFLNNIIFQLFNHFLLPSPTLARLVNIYIFRYNNKILFVTSSFLGWLIGHIFFMKWVGWVVFWIRQNPSIIAMPRIGRRHARSNKYLVADLRTSMGRILSILLFITCAYNLGGIPSPIFTKKLKENSKKKKEMGESEEETDVEIETTSDSEEIQVDEEEKTKEKFEKPIVTLLFDYKRWNRPLRYITTNQPANAVRNENEMAQYFFATCLSDGKQRISFTYPPSLSTFFEMIQKRWFLDTTETRSSEELYNRWVSTNEQKRKSLSNEFIKRIEALDKGSLDDVLEKRTRLYNDGTEQNCLPKVYDPFLSGPHRGTIRNFDLDSSINNPLNNPIEDSLTSMWNKLKLQDILPNDFREFEDQEDKRKEDQEDKRKEDQENKKSEDQQQKEYQYQSALSAFEDEDKEYQSAFEDEDREIRSEFAGEPRPNTALNLNENDEIENLEIAIENFEIEKKVPRWSYKLNVDWGDLENEPKDNEEEENQAYDICSPEVRRVVIYTEKETENETENETEKETETGANARTIEKNTKTTTDEDKTDKTAENARTIENPKTTTDEDKTDKTAENIKTTTDEDKTDKTAENARTIENPKNTIKDKEDKKEEEEPEEIALLSYLEEPDFDRDLIKGSMRAQRRKISIFPLFHPYVRSPLFLGQEDRKLFFFFSFDILEMQSLLFRIRNLVGKCVEFKTFHSHSKDTEEKKKKRLEQAEQKDPREEVEEKKVADFFELYEAQRLRGVLLVTLSFLRKYIILPSLIIAKNIGRMLLFQCPEWREDWKAWSKEMHVKCTYEGIPLSENEFPQNWLDDGIQIKILFPFDLKPWHKPQVESNHKDPMKKKGKGKKGNFCFLTPFGMEAEGPFGPYREKPSFFKPIWKEIDTNLKKVKKEGFLALRILKQRTKRFRKVLKKQIRWIFKIIGFIKRKIQELRKVKTIPVSEWEELSINRKNDNDIVSNNPITESLDQVRSMDWINDSLTSKKIPDMADSTNAIKDQIKTITTETIKIIRIPDIEMSSKKPSYDDKKLEPQKGVLQIFKRRNTRLIRKWHYFVKLFIERIYIEIPLYIINSMRINVKVFLESNKNTFVKYSPNDEPNQKKMRFISTIKESLSISNSSNNNEYSFCDLASLSQAYVFYKLSQTQIINKYHWKSVLQYQGTLLFLKDQIKDSFRKQGISHSKSGHKKIHNMRINEWKNWLRGRYHYQYNLSKPQWSRLVAQTQKWRNRIQKSSMVQTKNSQNLDFYKQKKDQLIHYENEKNKNYAKAPVLNKKLKNYKYDRLSHKYIHYEDKKGSYISRSPLQVNEGNELLFNYKNKKYSLELYDLSEDVVGTGSLKKREDYDRHRNRERKYFDWRIFDFSLKTKMEDIEFWLDLDIEVNILKNIKKRNIYPKIDKEDKKDKKKTFSLAIDKQLNAANRTKNIFDWMGMNEERIKMDPISKTSTLKLSFLPPEFVSLYDTYKIQPWSIPINSLLFNFDGDENAIEKKDSELETKKKEENKKSVQGNIGSDGSNQQKDLKEDSNKNDKQPKKKKTSELDLLLKKNSVFQAKLDEPSPLYSNNVLYDNIKVISLLVRLQNPTEITLISIKREDLRVELIPLTNTQPIAELVKKGYLFIEPAKLSIKWDGQSIMYQTITVLHVLKNKQKMKSYQKSQEKRNVDVDKKGFYKPIPRHKKLLGNREKNHNDLLVIENILSPRRRRELRIRLCLNSGDGNVVDRDLAFCKGNKASTSNCLQVLDKGKSFDINAKKFMKFQLFLWPNYRLEDLACMNRYWFDTNNGSCFSMSRIRMYPQLRIT